MAHMLVRLLNNYNIRILECIFVKSYNNAGY